MTCRCCRDAGQPPYEVADVMAFVVKPPPDRQQPVADGSDHMPGDDGHRDGDSDDAARDSTAPAGAYRFAWSG